MIDTKALATYLNDHLGGSGGAIDLLSRLQRSAAGRDAAGPVGEVRGAVIADRDTLVSMMTSLGIERSLVKRLAGHLAESGAALRFHPRLTGDRALSEVLILESLLLGISGKRILWLGLQQLAGDDPRLARYDLPGLLRRADAQLETLEGLRQNALDLAFTR